MPKVSAAHEQARREQILAAAMACFARSGYSKTSMDDIVRESGLSVGAIYSYFSSKEDLFLGLCEQGTEQTLAAFRELYERPGSMAEKNRAAVDLFFLQMSEDLVPLARVRLEFWSEALRSEALKAQRAQLCQAGREFLVSLMIESKRKGEMRRDVDEAAAAELILALNDGILMHHVSGVQPVPLDQLERVYIALLNNGLASPSGSFLTTQSGTTAATTRGRPPISPRR